MKRRLMFSGLSELRATQKRRRGRDCRICGRRRKLKWLVWIEGEVQDWECRSSCAKPTGGTP